MMNAAQSRWVFAWDDWTPESKREIEAWRWALKRLLKEEKTINLLQHIYDHWLERFSFPRNKILDSLEEMMK